MKKLKISQLAPDFRYLQKLALKLSAREPELLVQQPRVLVYGTVILLVVVTRHDLERVTQIFFKWIWWTAFF